MEKNAMLTPESKGDFVSTKPARYVEKNGYQVADEDNKHRLKNPVPIKYDDKGRTA